jgi:hypothetical protein
LNIMYGLSLTGIYLLTACGGSKKAVDTTTPGPGSDRAAVVAPACADEGAGHDSANAMALAAGASDGCTGTEPDFYSVLAPDHSAGTLHEVTLRATEGDLTATIFDQDQRELGAATAGKGQETRMYVVLATNSRMFVRVNGSSLAPAAYAVTNKASPLIDEDEVNDTAEQARPLNLDKTRTALLQTAANGGQGSADFYRVLVGRDGTLQVNVEPGTDEVTLAVEIHDRTGKRIGDATAANAGAAVSVGARVKRGDFVIKVWASDDAPTRAFSVGAAPRYLQDGYRITATRK